MKFIYTYGYRPEERSLCHLEMRALFGEDTDEGAIISTTGMDPSRSPFVRERIEVIYEAPTWESLCQQVQQLQTEKTFKVMLVQHEEEGKIPFQRRREMEKEIGMLIQGEAAMQEPEQQFAIFTMKKRWYFGLHEKNDAVWLRHMKKPQEYSTALSTRVARAIVNIGVPKIEGVRAIDPCCGIGTVLVEGRSMGVAIVGRDINPLVVQGSRENLAHFQLEGEVVYGPIAEVTDAYDVAIIDMPYNLYTHATREDQFAILQHARRIAKRVVVLTIDDMDDLVAEVGFVIVDRGEAQKSRFTRQVLVCE